MSIPELAAHLDTTPATVVHRLAELTPQEERSINGILETKAA